MLQITGNILKSLPSKEWPGKNGGTNLKRTFVINVPGDKPYDLAIEVMNEKGDILKSLSKGDSVTCTCTIASREYQNKYFTAVTATKIERATEKPVGQARSQRQTTTEYDEVPTTDESLPF